MKENNFELPISSSPEREKEYCEIYYNADCSFFIFLTRGRLPFDISSNL